MNQLDLLNDIFGSWNGSRWQAAQFTGYDIDLTHFESAIQASNLKEREKLAVILRFFRQKSYREIGDTLNVSRARVNQIVHSGKRKLRAPYNLRHIKRAISGWFNHHRHL